VRRFALRVSLTLSLLVACLPLVGGVAAAEAGSAYTAETCAFGGYYQNGVYYGALTASLDVPQVAAVSIECDFEPNPDPSPLTHGAYQQGEAVVFAEAQVPGQPGYFPGYRLSTSVAMT